MNSFELSFDQIISILDRLGIKYESLKTDSRNRLSVLCPNVTHNDKNFGNAYIYTNYPYAVTCFVCGYHTNIIKVICDRLNVSYGEAFKFLKNELNIETSFLYNVNENLKPKIKKNKVERIEKSDYDKLYLKEFNSDDFYYTKVRGISKEFIKKYNIKYCFGGLKNKYNDYIIIPIKDKFNNVDTFEARRLCEYEVLQKVLETKEKDLTELREYFKSYIEYFKIVYNKKEKKLYKNGELITDLNVEYLLKPKTLYPFESNVLNTIFDYENLDKNKPLMFSEGIGSLSKMQTVYDNCSCVFGVNLSDDWKQKKLLLNFPELWIIPDYNYASDKMISILNEVHPIVKVFDINCNDECIEFEKKLNTTNLILASVFLKRRNYEI